MGGDAPAGPSLFQASADIVSSRHWKQKRQLHNHHHNHNRHNYIDLHRRQIDGTVTSVAATVSVIQQVVVDSNGSTIQVQTVVEDSTTTWTTSAPLTAIENPLTLSATVPALTELASPGGITSDIGLYSTAPYPQSLPITSQSATLIPSLNPPALPQILNSTSYTIALGNASLPLSNYTLTSTLSSPTVSLTTASTVPETSTTSSPFPSPTDINIYTQPTETPVGVDGSDSGTVTSGGSAPTSTAPTGGARSSSESTSPSTPSLIGGVVGGIAGFAFIVIFLVFIVRWKKRHPGILPLSGGEDSGAGAALAGGSGPSQSQPVVERSHPFAIPSALASLTGYKRESQQRSVAESTAGSERGFYRVSGRKLPSVFHSGGDGWGSPDGNMSGSSFYRDSQGFYGGPGGPPSPLGGPPSERDSGTPIMRPSPARTPITSQGAFASSPRPPQVDSPRLPDLLGRSRPSQDGSHGSKFHEDV